MANLNEEARIPVYINDEQAKSALKTLTSEAEKWRKKMYDAMSAGDLTGMKEAEAEIKKINKQTTQLKKDSFDVNKVLSNISAASPKDLRKAIQALNRDMEDLNRNTKEYAAKQEQLKLLRSEFYGVNSAIREQRGLISKTADFVNRYWSILSGVALTFVGIKSTMDDATKASGDFEERVDNLSSLTGLAGDNLEWLEQKAKDLSTSTLEGGIKVKQGAQDIVDAFTKTGSARPELLKNKEALVETTQEAIILANAAKTDLQPAIESLTMMLNQFNAPAEDSRRIINALAAGSKEGAGEIPYLTQAVEKSGTVASDAHLSYETLIATIETLAPRISQPEIAGRTLKGVLLDLQKGADDTNPALVGMTTALENLGKKNLSTTQLAKMFGEENITTARILIKNVDELKRYEKAVTGTNVAIEQATTNTDNRNAKLAQAKNKLQNVRSNLEKLTPILTMSTSASTLFLKVLSALVGIGVKYSGTIITATSAIAAYTIGTKLSVLWKERENKATLANIISGKIQTIVYNAQFAAVSLYNAALALLKGNVALATIQFRAFSAALMANPVGLIAGLVVGLGFALYSLTGRLTAAQKAQKAVNDVSIDAQKNIAEEKVKLDLLLKTARNKNLSDETRKKAMKEINELSPEHLGNLTLEKINTEEARKATDNYTASLLKNAKAQAAKEKLVEIEKQLIDLQNGKGADTSFWQDAWNMATSAGNAAVYAGKSVNTALSNVDEKTKALIETRKRLSEQMDKDNAAGSSSGSGGGNDDTKQGQDLIALKEKELENAKAMIATTPAEVAARNKKVEAIQNEINKLNQLGTSKEGKADDPIVKKRIESAEAEYAAKTALLKKNHLETKGSEDQYNANLLQAEFDFLTKKLTIYKKGSKEYEETQTQLLEKQVEAENTVKDLILKAQNTLADAKIENLQDGIAKEKALEEQRWKEELDGLKKQLNTATDLKNDEIALNDTINQTIEEKKAAHLKKMADIDKAEELRKKKNIADKFGGIEQYDNSIPFVGLDLLQEYFNNRKSLLEQQYDFEKKAAGDNAKLITQIEEKYAEKRNRLSETEIQAVFEMTSRKIEIGQAYLGALSQIFGQESALGKALFLFSQGLAIADVWIKAAASNATIYSTALAEFAWLGPGAVPAATAFAAAPIAANNTNAALQTGLIAAQTIANFVKGYSEGGHTGPGGKYEPAGIVHRKEYVIPEEGTDNPQLRPFIDLIEIARRNGSLARLDLRPVVAMYNGSGKKGYSSGGPVGSSTPSPSTPLQPAAAAIDSDTARELTEAIKAFNKKKLVVYSELIKKDIETLQEIEDNRGL